MTLEKKFLIEGQNTYYGVGATGIPNSENKLGLSCFKNYGHKGVYP